MKNILRIGLIVTISAFFVACGNKDNSDHKTHTHKDGDHKGHTHADGHKEHKNDGHKH